MPPNLNRLSGSTDHHNSALASWLADCVVDEAAAARSRQRSLQQQVAEESSLAGVLLDLAEQQHFVSIKTVMRHTCEGQIISVGADFVLLLSHDNEEILIPVHSVAVIKGGSTNRRCLGARTLSRVGFTDIVGGLVADKAQVVVVSGDERIFGILQGAGFDVIALASQSTNDFDSRELVHVGRSAIDHIIILMR